MGNRFDNPVIPGFYPDPSICRVGSDFYLATSSFCYFPGVPLWHSRDLVNWHQVGHALHRPPQLPLDGLTPMLGIYAPTLRHRDGRFYVIVTNMPHRGQLIVTADDPAGPWSDPVTVDTHGFDPDLFWDDDGRCFMAQHNLHRPGISAWEIDPSSGSLLSGEQLIWEGYEDPYCEAPHIYKVEGRYCLVVAEGGTHRGHMVVAARADHPMGPWEGCPWNPVLSHRGRVANPIQATGHGDLVEATDGTWWMVFLGIRPVRGYHTLGRETFLAPVEWRDGWPVVNGGQAVELEMDGPGLARHPWPVPPTRIDFPAGRDDLRWVTLRHAPEGAIDTRAREGWLRIHGPAGTLAGRDAVAFLAMRQTHFEMRVETLLEFTPGREGEEAGLVAFMNETCFAALCVTTTDGGRRSAVLRQRTGELEVVRASVALPEGGAVGLRIISDSRSYRFVVRVDGGEWIEVAAADARYLSQEVAMTFTGVMFGLYATGTGQESGAPADFAWFEVEPVGGG